MSLLNTSLTLYLMIGAGVALAVYLAGQSGSRTDRLFRVATALPFWPLYVPMLLRGSEAVPSPAERAPQDDMAAAIAQVDDELQTALASLHGWAEAVLVREKDRLAELRSAWTAQAERIREMDRLLEHQTVRSAHEPANSRLKQCEQARLRNWERLHRLRQRAHDDLMATLAAVRELVSMIHLAKFTGAPASRAEEIVAQIAAAVEGLSVATEHGESDYEIRGSTADDPLKC